MKVVIAAAMWNNPHVLVLDEPTNYLDRESLGALAGAIKDFGGGVIMITHNSGAPPNPPPAPMRPPLCSAGTGIRNARHLSPA